MLTAMNTRSRRGLHGGHFFVKDLGLVLALKMRPDQSQAFKEVNNSQAFTVKYIYIQGSRSGCG